MLQTETRTGRFERLKGLIRGFLLRIGGAAGELWKTPPAKAESGARALAVTTDAFFYSGLRSASESCGFGLAWARSLKQALRICRSWHTPIVIYDDNLPGADWRQAFEQLSGAAPDARLFLAAPEIDEELWRNAVRCHGYDVLARSAGPDELRRELRFARLSLERSGLDESTPAVVYSDR